MGIENVKEKKVLDEGSDQKTVIFLPSALTESFEIVLGRVADLVKQGRELELIYCDGAIRGCVANSVGLKSTCRHCRLVRDRAISELAPEARKIPLDSYKNRSVNCLPDASIKASLASSVESTMLTFYRRNAGSFAPWDPRDMIFSHVRTQFLKYSQFIYECVLGYIAASNSNRIEFFNGRILPNFAVREAVVASGKEYAVIEVAGYQRQLVMVNNSMIHDFDYRQRALKQFIESGKADLFLGRKFFDDRRQGIATDTISFTATQRSGLIDYDEKPILAVFTSSTDEFDFLGDQWFTQASKDPASFIVRVAELVGDNYRVVVRMHPNQAGDYTGAAKRMQLELSQCELVELITPQDPQSTYELIDKSALVLSFGSSVGIEATYSAKPSILAGRAVWDFLDVAYYVTKPEDVKALVGAGLKEKKKDEALTIASYYMIGDGAPGSLVWNPEDKLFYADGKNYLDDKKDSLSYYLANVVDKVLRL